jgi:hypothetical protein
MTSILIDFLGCTLFVSDRNEMLHRFLQVIVRSSESALPDGSQATKAGAVENYIGSRELILSPRLKYVPALVIPSTHI